MVELNIDLPKSRLESLYKDFRNMEELNPDGYQANIDTWKEFLVKKYFSKGPITFQCGSSFLSALLISPYGFPKSIDIVLDSLIYDGYLVSFDDLLKGDTDVLMDGDVSGNKSGLWNYIQWFSSKLTFNKKSITRDDKNKNNNDALYLKELQYVVVDNLRKKYDRIYDIMRKNILNDAVTITSIVYDKEDFLKKSGIEQELNKNDTKVMLTYMERYKHIIIQKDSIVKIIDPSLFGNLLKNFDQDITLNDERIVSVKVGIYNMEKQIQRLKNELNDLKLKSSGKNSDLLSERSKIRIQQTRQLTAKYLTQLIDGLSNLQAVKNQLDICGTNQLLVETLNGSNEVIKNINSYIGSVEKVEELLDSINEESMKTEEINNALTLGNLDNVDKFNEEIEQELNDLENANKNVSETTKDDQNMEKVMDKLKDLNVSQERSSDESKTESKIANNNEKILQMEEF